MISAEMARQQTARLKGCQLTCISNLICRESLNGLDFAKFTFKDNSKVDEICQKLTESGYSYEIETVDNVKTITISWL